MKADEDRISERMPDCHVTIFPVEFEVPDFSFVHKAFTVLLQHPVSWLTSKLLWAGAPTHIVVGILVFFHCIIRSMFYGGSFTWQFRCGVCIIFESLPRSSTTQRYDTRFVISQVVAFAVFELTHSSLWLQWLKIGLAATVGELIPPAFSNGAQAKVRIHLTFFRPNVFATTAILFIKAYVEMYAGKMQKKKVTCKEIMATILSTKWTMWILLTSHDFLHLLQTRISSRQHTSLWFYSSWRLYLFIWHFGPSLGQVPSSLWFWSGCLFLIFAFWCQLQCKTWPPLHCWPFSCKNTHSIHSLDKSQGTVFFADWTYIPSLWFCLELLTFAVAGSLRSSRGSGPMSHNAGLALPESST